MITPYNVKPNKKRAFRIIKKWFNRYEREDKIADTLLVIENIKCRLIDIRMVKCNGGINFNIKAVSNYDQYRIDRRRHK